MIKISIPIGKNIYNIHCHPDQAEKIQSLGESMNIAVNKNYSKYPGMSHENVFLITSLQILAQLQRLQEGKKGVEYELSSQKSEMQGLAVSDDKEFEEMMDELFQITLEDQKLITQIEIAINDDEQLE